MEKVLQANSVYVPAHLWKQDLYDLVLNVWREGSSGWLLFVFIEDSSKGESDASSEEGQLPNSD